MNCPNCGYELAASDKVCRKCGTPRPQIDERFKGAEDEYFRLKGQLQVGRITVEQFNAALEKLAVVDSRGLQWTLGPDSGKWYVYNGHEWVQADPQGTGAAPTAENTPADPATGPLGPSPLAATMPLGSAYHPQPIQSSQPVQPVQPTTPPISVNVSAEQIVTCGKCGYSNSAGRRFCTRCGSPLAQAGMPVTASTYVEPPLTGQLPPPGQARGPAPNYGVVAPVPTTARKSRRGTCVGCCLGVLLLVVGVPVLGYFLISNGVISQRVVLNAVGLGTGEINISNLSDDALTATLAPIDAQTGSAGSGTDRNLKAMEIHTYAAIQPGRYQLTVPAKQGGGACTLKIDSGDVYNIAVLRTDVIIARDKEPAQSTSDLSFGSSPLCKR